MQILLISMCQCMYSTCNELGKFCARSPNEMMNGVAKCSSMWKTCQQINFYHWPWTTDCGEVAVQVCDNMYYRKYKQLIGHVQTTV